MDIKEIFTDIEDSDEQNRETVAQWFDTVFGINIEIYRPYGRMGDFGARFLLAWGKELRAMLEEAGVNTRNLLTPMTELVHLNIKQYNATGVLLEYELEVKRKPCAGGTVNTGVFVPTGKEVTPADFGFYDYEEVDFYGTATTVPGGENKEENSMYDFDIKAIEMSAEQQKAATEAIRNNPFALAAYYNATVVYDSKTYAPVDLFKATFTTLDGIYQSLTAAEADAKKSISLFTGVTEVDPKITAMEAVVKAVFSFKLAEVKASEQAKLDKAIAEEDAQAARDILKARKYDKWRAEKSDDELRAIGCGLAVAAVEEVPEVETNE